MNTGRVDQQLFENEHYLGKPADDEDRIITRRIEIMQRYPEFFNRAFSLIEVGCGPGATINRIAARFRHCLGVDIYNYNEAFEQSRIRFSAANSSFLQMDLEKELPQEKFDRLVSFEVIEHLKDENSIASYFNVLKDGGMAAITVPNKWWVFETHGAKLPLLPWNRVPFFSWLPRSVHERYANARIYTLKRITALLERHGFHIVDHCYVTAPMDVVKNRFIKNLLVNSIFKNDSTKVPFLSTSIFIMAQKRSES